MIALLLILVVALSVLSACAYHKITKVQTAMSMEKSRSHAMCVASIFSVVGDAHAARTLRSAADRWDSVEEAAMLTRMAREKYKPGGPSMPAIWMRAEADRLDPQSIKEVAEQP